MKINKMSVEDFLNLNEKHNFRCPRSSRSSSENYEKAKEIQQTISEIRSLQTYCPPILFDGAYRLDVVVHGRTRADEDNIRKAINDAIQGCATRNDRDSRGGSITLC